MLVVAAALLVAGCSTAGAPAAPTVLRTPPAPTATPAPTPTAEAGATSFFEFGLLPPLDGGPYDEWVGFGETLGRGDDALLSCILLREELPPGMMTALVSREAGRYAEPSTGEGEIHIATTWATRSVLHEELTGVTGQISATVVRYEAGTDTAAMLDGLSAQPPEEIVATIEARTRRTEILSFARLEPSGLGDAAFGFTYIATLFDFEVGEGRVRRERPPTVLTAENYIAAHGNYLVFLERDSTGPEPAPDADALELARTMYARVVSGEC